MIAMRSVRALGCVGRTAAPLARPAQRRAAVSAMVQRVAPVRQPRWLHVAARRADKSPLQPSSKPLPRGSVAGPSGKSTAAKACALGVLAGLAGYWGYHLYETKQTPAEWVNSMVEWTKSSLRDVADPTEDFIRNSMMPMHVINQHNLKGTVIVTIEGTLLARKWDRKHGYRYSKRPYCDEFLMQLAQNGFELVFFSDLPTATATDTLNQILMSMPPGSVSCNGLLTREHMFVRDSEHVKRLDYLPRDMQQVVLVDHDPNSYKWNPNNTLLVKKYEEFDATDDSLKKAAAMILTMRSSGQPYQRFLNKYATPTRDAEGHLVPKTDAVEAFAREQREKERVKMVKKTSGVSGALRRLKSSSSNLKNSKVLSPGTLSVREIMTTKPTDVSKKPQTLWERKMAKLHKRQRDWEEAARLRQAAAAEAADKPDV